MPSHRQRRCRRTLCATPPQRTILALDVATLAQLSRRDAVEGTPLVVHQRPAVFVQAKLAGAQRAEILASDGQQVRAELKRDAPGGSVA